MSERKTEPTKNDQQIVFLGGRVLKLSNEVTRLRKLMNDRDAKFNTVIDRLKKAIPHVNFDD